MGWSIANDSREPLDPRRPSLRARNQGPLLLQELVEQQGAAALAHADQMGRNPGGDDSGQLLMTLEYVLGTVWWHLVWSRGEGCTHTDRDIYPYAHSLRCETDESVHMYRNT
jgi:hypothetical protein